METASAPAKFGINSIELGDIFASLAQGWRDFMSAPLLGLFFGGFYGRP